MQERFGDNAQFHQKLSKVANGQQDEIQEEASSQHSKPKSQTATAEGGCATQAIHPQAPNYSIDQRILMNQLSLAVIGFPLCRSGSRTNVTRQSLAGRSGARSGSLPGTPW